MKLYINVFVLWITECGCFLRYPSDVDLQYKANINVGVSEGRRTRRSADDSYHPQLYDLDLLVDQSAVNLHLIRNDDIQTNVPTFSLSGGVPVEQVLDNTEDSIFYQDVNSGAAFVVQYNKELLWSMFGTFNTAGGEYILQTADMSNSSFNLGFSQFEIIKEKQKQVDFDDFLNNGLESIMIPGQHHRQKRATGVHQIELLIVCDYSIYKYWYDKSKQTTSAEKELEAFTSVRQFYAFIINGMDAMYKNIQTSSYTISVVFAGIIIAQSPDNSTWTETIKNTTFTPNRVDSSNGLSNFRTWIQATTGLPEHDHAMLYTRLREGHTCPWLIDCARDIYSLGKEMYDLTSSGSTGNAGLASVSTMCTSSSQSIVEDGFDFIMITVASHELGHSLSAGHDGEGNTCSITDSYIMAASSSPQTNSSTATHPWIFSTCSTTYFTNYIKALDRASNNCMKTVGSSFDPTALSPYDQTFAGQLYDADAQCAEIYNSSSYMCRGHYNNDYSTICSVLWCLDPTTSRCGAHIAGERTLCGSNKWCVSGNCKSDANAPSGNDKCLYGDRRGIIYSGVDWTCADIIVNAKTLCNTTVGSTTCCESCAPPTTTSITTDVETTTQGETTQKATTTETITTTHTDTTTKEVTTTQPETTTQEVTTTEAQTTTQETTTTEPQATTQEITTTDPQPTTQEITTTQEVTAQPHTTQSITTTQPDTTIVKTTVQLETTQTTVQTVTSIIPDVTTLHVTTDEETTTHETDSTSVVFTVHDSANTQQYTLIGVSAAVGALLILGIGAGCLTWYCKRLRESSSKSDKSKYDPFMINGHTYPPMVHDEIENRNVRQLPGNVSYNYPSYNYPMEDSHSGRFSYAHPSAWYPQYKIQDTTSFMGGHRNKGYRNGGYLNRGYQHDTFQNAGYF